MLGGINWRKVKKNDKNFRKNSKIQNLPLVKRPSRPAFIWKLFVYNWVQVVWNLKQFLVWCPCCISYQKMFFGCSITLRPCLNDLGGRYWYTYEWKLVNWSWFLFISYPSLVYSLIILSPLSGYIFENVRVYQHNWAI